MLEADEEDVRARAFLGGALHGHLFSCSGVVRGEGGAWGGLTRLRAGGGMWRWRRASLPDSSARCPGRLRPVCARLALHAHVVYKCVGVGVGVGVGVHRHAEEPESACEAPQRWRPLVHAPSPGGGAAPSLHVEARDQVKWRRRRTPEASGARERRAPPPGAPHATHCYAAEAWRAPTRQGGWACGVLGGWWGAACPEAAEAHPRIQRLEARRRGRPRSVPEGAVQHCR